MTLDRECVAVAGRVKMQHLERAQGLLRKVKQGKPAPGFRKQLEGYLQAMQCRWCGRISYRREGLDEASQRRKEWMLAVFRSFLDGLAIFYRDSVQQSSADKIYYASDGINS